MDTTETQNRQGSRDKAAHDNVVRLPRDWLGPREDLVPFGPSAYRDEPEQARELPKNADDFWGGADLPDDDGATTSLAASTAPTRGWSLPTRARLVRPRVRLRVGARTILFFGLGVLGVLAAIGFALGSAARKPSAIRPRMHASGRTAASAPSYDARASGLRDVAAERVSRARAREAARVRRRAEIRRRQRADARRHHEHRTKSTVQPVHYTTPTPAPSSDSASSFSAPSTGGNASASQPLASSRPASSASSASNSRSSGSSNQPAIGANGTLGPGSSPDG